MIFPGNDSDGKFVARISDSSEGRQISAGSESVTVCVLCQLRGRSHVVSAGLALFSGAGGGNKRCGRTVMAGGERTNSQSSEGERLFEGERKFLEGGRRQWRRTRRESEMVQNLACDFRRADRCQDAEPASATIAG